MEITDIKGYYETPVTHLNIILGGSGIPLPSMIEIFGVEDTAKSTVALFMGISFLNSTPNSKMIYIDSEFKLDKKRFEYMMFTSGISKDRYEVFQNNFIEDISDKIKKTLINNELEGIQTVIIWDTIATIISKDVKEAGYSAAKVTSKLTEEFKYISRLLNKTKSHIIINNQVRENLSMGRGYKTPKGRMLKHIVNIRMQLSGKGKEVVKIGNMEVEKGILTEVFTKKNHLFIPRFRGLLYITEKGVDALRSVYEQCIEYKIIQSSGAWKKFEFADVDVKWRGFKEFKKIVSDTPKIIDYLNYLLYKRFADVSELSKIKLIDKIWKIEEMYNLEKTELTDREKELYDRLMEVEQV